MPLEKTSNAPACIPWLWPHPASLQQLEHSLDALHLSSFGLMDTTLEEVFLKVSEEDQSLENSEAGKSSQAGDQPGQPTKGPWGHGSDSGSGIPQDQYRLLVDDMVATGILTKSWHPVRAWGHG